MRLPACRITPIRAHVPPADDRRCQAANCQVPIQAIVVALVDGWSRLEQRGVCIGHGLAFRELGGCCVFPLGAQPSMGAMLEAVNTEIARRRQRVAGRHSWSYGGQTTTSGGFYFNFG
ncbi:MAG: hypothetical protein JO222_09360 [Frankiales bacterium]|nr:hypothetical protein [Frankiales bacterium]